MKVLVTGSAGHLGEALVRVLGAEGDEVTGLDILESPHTAIAGARDPIRMARAMKLAVEAGRDAFLAGRIPRKRHANASSPIDGLFF